MKRGAAVLAVLVTGAAGTIYLAAPTPQDLNRRVAAQLRPHGGQQVRVAAIAPVLRQAVIATEDERFYSHHGIDIVGVLRAIPYDIAHLSFAQGASTITEQLAKVLYFGGNDHAPWRKAEAAATALKIEARYSKEQILGAYLNSIYFGAGAWGIANASRTYFNESPSKLDLAQASLLAGLVQAPSRYDPFQHQSAARARQTDVLRAMVQNGFLTGAEAERAIARPLALRRGVVLAPSRGVSFVLGPELRLGRLLLGLLLVAVGVSVFALRRLRPFPLWRLAALTATAVGVLLSAASYPFL